MNGNQLISPKSFATALDCSLSMLYALRTSDPNFPAPEVKLFGKSKRGMRWTSQQVELYILSNRKQVKTEQQEEERPFVRVRRKEVASNQ